MVEQSKQKICVSKDNKKTWAQDKTLVCLYLISNSSKLFQVNWFPFVLQLESYIQDSMKQEIVQFQQAAVQNHTATMIEIGTNLLSQTAEQTRKLTNVEAQVRQDVLLKNTK